MTSHPLSSIENEKYVKYLRAQSEERKPKISPSSTVGYFTRLDLMLQLSSSHVLNDLSLGVTLTAHSLRIVFKTYPHSGDITSQVGFIRTRQLILHCYTNVQCFGRPRASCWGYTLIHLFTSGYWYLSVSSIVCLWTPSKNMRTCTLKAWYLTSQWQTWQLSTSLFTITLLLLLLLLLLLINDLRISYNIFWSYSLKFLFLTLLHTTPYAYPFELHAPFLLFNNPSTIICAIHTLLWGYSVECEQLHQELHL